MDTLRKLLEDIYPDNVAELEKEVERTIQIAQKISHQEHNSGLWYKDINLYVVYPDAIKRPRIKPLNSLIDHLNYVKDMGFNTVHVLPFLDSPMVDAGFDVSDYFKIRQDLGDLDDLKRFITTANHLNIKLFMDMVLNHISDKHEWFLKAEAGDEKYQKYFFTLDEEPKFLRIENKNAAVWAIYEDKDGNEIEASIAFPETCGPIPHWRKGKNNLWYYHTYYPEQPDVNWFNADLFLEFVIIMTYWASMGFSFRLDAIPFVGKRPYKDASSGSVQTNKIIRLLYYICSQINPEIALLVESFEHIPTIINYFGSTNTEQAQLAYNFHLCTNMWVSLATEDTKYIWQELKNTNKIPIHASWINFLRNHDELSLAYLSDELNTKVNKEFGKHGKPFRGRYGIAGRTFSLLGKNKKRFLMAYFLLSSVAGNIALIYGDELGMTNIPDSKLNQQLKKDARNINRGKLTPGLFRAKSNTEVYEKISEMMKSKEVFKKYINVLPRVYKLPDEDSSIFAAIYSHGASELIVLINLSKDQKIIKSNFKDFEKVSQVNYAILGNGRVRLGAYGGLWIQK